MNRLVKYMLISGVSALLSATQTNAQETPAVGQPPQGGGPQNRRNFDPAQMRERMMERYHTQLEVTDDAEWKIIKERIEKVQTLQMQSRMNGMMGGRGQRGGGPGGAPNADNAARPQRMPGMEPNPEMEALQKALEDKAPKEEIKDKLAKVRESRKAKEAELEKAQEELKAVLSARQEAQAVVMGLLK